MPKEFSVFSTGVTLKIRSKSRKANQFFVMSQLYMHENLVRIQALVHKKLYRQESDLDADANGICTINNISPSPEAGGT